MKTNPLDLAIRMAGKSAELFSRIGRPGFALFSDAGRKAVAEAQQVAADAAREDHAALAAIDDVLADGRVDAGEVDLLRFARQKVKRSAGLDERLTGGAVS